MLPMSDSDSDSDCNVTLSGNTLTDRGDIIARYAHKISTDPIKHAKIHRDRANRATVEQVLDPRAMRSLAKIFNTGVITRINGCISTGKEANVYHGEKEVGDTEETGDSIDTHEGNDIGFQRDSTEIGSQTQGQGHDSELQGGKSETQEIKVEHHGNKIEDQENKAEDQDAGVEATDNKSKNKTKRNQPESNPSTEVSTVQRAVETADTIQSNQETVDNASRKLEEGSPQHTQNFNHAHFKSDIVTDTSLVCSSPREYALKIYKTAILVFKDRERYVDGEHRFRNAKNNHNSFKMVKVWAEKEFRNLKRLHHCGIACPEPIMLKSHILVMEYLTRGKGQPLPKLRDYKFRDSDEVVAYYHEMIYVMRRLYQECRLVHADLSEYNSMVHQNRLYIIDVSQLVEPEHPMALDFLRMDIKNVNDFFSRQGIYVYPERHLFRFITEHYRQLGMEDTLVASMAQYLEQVSLKVLADDEAEDQVFRSLHLVRSLNHLDERDFEKFQAGKVDTLTQLVEEAECNSDSSAGSTSDSDDEVSDSEERIKPGPRGKKFEDKDEKKARKELVKKEKQEQRKTKMKKHIKKKIINKRKAK